MATAASQSRSLPFDPKDVRSRLSCASPSDWYSLCELRLSEQEYLRLDRWIREHLDSTSLNVNGWHAGLNLFIWITETARREGTTNEIWPTITDNFTNKHGIASQLFVRGHQQPTERLKELLCDVARRMSLRHVFDEADSQRWYDTINLQFGFSFHAMEANLPDWLRGVKPPVAIERLLNGPLTSRSFIQLWRALMLFRRDRLTEHDLRETLLGSPWVLPGWHEALTRRARDRHGAAEEMISDDADGETAVLLTAAGCKWSPSDGLTFSFRVEELASPRLSRPHYDLLVDTRFVARFIRQTDGTFSPEPRSIELQATVPRAVIALVSDEGNQELCDVLEYWDPSADINVFDLVTGCRVTDPFRDPLNQRHAHLLRLRPGLSIEQNAPGQSGKGDLFARFVEFLPGPSCRLAVYDSRGSLVWEPVRGVTTANGGEPDWLRGVDVRVCPGPETFQIGQKVIANVRGLSPGIAVRSVRVSGGDALELDDDSFSFILTPDVASSGCAVSLGIERVDAGQRAQQVIIRRKLPLSVGGAAVLVRDQWHALSGQRVETTELMRNAPIRFFLPDWAPASKGALMEGSVFQGWRSTRASQLRGLRGLGAPLAVQRAPYNCPSDRETVVGCITSQGLIQRVTIDRELGICRIDFRHSVEPAAEHQIVWWEPASGTFELLIGDDVEPIESGRVWNLSWGAPLEPSGSSTVLALAYNGRWLGCGRAGSPVTDIARLNCSAAVAHLTAALARWCRLPLLLRRDRDAAPIFAGFATRYPEAVFAAWLTGSGMPLQSLFFDDDSEWRDAEGTALREIYQRWVPTEEESLGIVAALGKSNADDPLFEAAKRLLFVDPILMGRLMVAWLCSVGPPKGSRSVRWYLAVMREGLLQKPAKLGNDPEPCTLDGHACTTASGLRCGDYFLCRAARKILGSGAADTYFVMKALAEPALATLAGHEMPEDCRENFLVASHVASFREYLATRVFERVEAILG